MYNSKSLMDMMMDMKRGMMLCTSHAKRALNAFNNSTKLKPFIDNGSMILPKTADFYNFVINMPVGSRVLKVSFSIAPDRGGNRYEMGEISESKPPSTMEILLRDVFDEYFEDLGYDGDIRSFSWNVSLSDDGFEEIIDEFLRILNIINPSA